ERIAAFQTDDAASPPGGANHERVDAVLRQRVTALALADEESLRVPRIAEDPLVNQRVVEHEIRRAQARDGFPRQQSGIARSGADEGNVTGFALVRSVHL